MTSTLETTSSLGAHGSATQWLDAHFQAAQPEYLQILRESGIQLGWQVLDAGAGSGSFLPFIADMVGTDGAITALDIAPENIAAIDERATEWGFPCHLETRVGSVTNLPFAADTFDAVWCANTTLYLSDDKFLNALRQFQSVVKPGGLVAIKEVDLGMTRLNPAPYGFFWRFLAASNQKGVPVHVHGALRSQHLKRTMEDLGFVNVHQHTTLIERWAPLRDVEKTYLAGILEFFAEHALDLELPAADQVIWTALSQSDSALALLDAPQFYWCEGNVLAVGRVP